METVICYRPTGQKELDLVAESDFKRWPPRLPEQPIFYPVTNYDYAVRLTQWNVTDFGKGYVTKFAVAKAFMDKYPVECVGDKACMEWWIPAEDLEQMNDHIVGEIEVIYETE